MKLFWKSRYLLLGIFLSTVGLSAQEIPKPMVPYRLVNDFADIFSPTEEEALERKLRAYNDSTSTQIYVVSVTDLGGYPVSDYAFRLGEAWAIGQKSKDNGAIILIKPKTGSSRGQAFIATGYGLEARINDAYAGRIIRNEMIPHFMTEDYFSGVNRAIDTMIARLSGEFVAEEGEGEGERDEEREGEGMPLFMIIVFAIAILLLISRFFGGDDQDIDGDGHRRTNESSMTGSSRSGGFSGGGGGRFGGGGAGGSW